MHEIHTKIMVCTKWGRLGWSTPGYPWSFYVGYSSNLYSLISYIINRPGVAGAVFKSALLLINYLIQSAFSS